MYIQKTNSPICSSSPGLCIRLIYINDIFNSSKKFDFYLFADDTNMLYADKNLKSLETNMNREFQLFCQWLDANKLTLNQSKSQTMLFFALVKKTQL